MSLGEWFVARKPELDRVREHIRSGMRELIDMRIQTPSLKGPRLPHPYIPVDAAPAWRYVFYWDTYFIVRQLIADGHIETARNQVLNFLDLFDRYGYVPNANVYAWASRSQPPLLSGMARLIYDFDRDRDFAGRCCAYLKKEYEDFWTGPLHLVPGTGMSRYQDGGFGLARLLGCPENALAHLQAEAESGWDFTPRFEGRCLHFLPVDLNAFLYRYETDLAWFADELSLGSGEAELWQSRAEKRRERFNEIFWDPERRFYFDYDFKNGRQGSVKSLAGYLPLWAGLAGEEQAAGLSESLPGFELEHGLAVCDHDYGMTDKQWNWPNAWPPLTWWTCEALRKNGYLEQAERITRKYLEAQAGLFGRTGFIWEKYNAMTGDLDVIGGHEHGSNPMLGWSASTFTDFYEMAGKAAGL